MKNILQLIPFRVRLTIYVGYALVALVGGSLNTWFATVDGSVPAWVNGVNAVLVFIGAGLGLTAAGNTNTPVQLALDLDHDDVAIEEPDTDEVTVSQSLGS